MVLTNFSIPSCQISPSKKNSGVSKNFQKFRTCSVTNSSTIKGTRRSLLVIISMERIVIHCHCKEGIDEVKMEPMKIKDLQSKQADNIVNIPSTSKETEHEQVDSAIKKVHTYCFNLSFNYRVFLILNSKCNIQNSFLNCKASDGYKNICYILKFVLKQNH